MSDSLIPSFLVGDVSESLRSLTKNERCEQIAQVAHQKWANERFTQVANQKNLKEKLVDTQKSAFMSFETKTFKKILLHIFLLF